MDLPFFIKDFEGIGGTTKERPEDFIVQEIPLYEPSKDGDHVMAEIQKVGMTTLDALDKIARYININRRDIGYAGMKDSRAITRQHITVPFTTPEALRNFKHEQIQILWSEKHRNKLRLSHLKGNRFIVKIRNVEPTKVVTIRPLLEIMNKRGMPNFFGEQRFGRRNNNDLLGAAFIRGDDKTVLRMMLGDPDPRQDSAPVFTARQCFMGGDYENALRAWPGWAQAECRVLQRYMNTRSATDAVITVDMPIRRLWISALQSRLFNSLLGKRIDNLDKLMDGDLAIKHDNGVVFPIDNAKLEQPRADTFEISATGPMLGRRMGIPRFEPRKMELDLFNQYKVHQDDFRSVTRDRSHGARRPLRVQPTDFNLESGVDEHGAYICVAFTLPPGAYATILLREIMRNDSMFESHKGKEDAPLEPMDENEE